MNRARIHNTFRGRSRQRGRWMNTMSVVVSSRTKKAAKQTQASAGENESPEILQEVESAESLEPITVIEKPKPTAGLDAYGCVYNVGAQKISVTVPGDTVPVKFSHGAYLSGVWHEDDTADIVIKEQGVYEISYALYLSGMNAAAVAFAVQADGETLPGSLQSRLLTAEEQAYSGMVVAELWKESTLRVIMTSGTVVSAEFKGSGVTASLILKKLN